MPKAKGIRNSAGEVTKRTGEGKSNVAKKKSKKDVDGQRNSVMTTVVAGGSSNSSADAGDSPKSTANGENNMQEEISSIVSQIQRQSDWLASATLDEMSAEVLKTRLDILNRAWDRFEGKQMSLQADGVASPQAVEDVYVRVRAELSTKIKATQPSFSTAVCMPIHDRPVHYPFAELPLADRLPTFSGSHREWIQFRDIFAAEVLQNPYLTDMQRLRRLQSCVKDDAARVLGYWPQRNDSFADAWRTLCLAYDNEYLCHAAHCSAIYNLPFWPKATHSLIRNMLDVTRNSLRMVSRQLGAEQQHDLFVLNFLESRLDSESRTQWEMVRPTDRIPNLHTDFFTWLERRSSGLLSHYTQSITYSRENQSSKPRPNGVLEKLWCQF